MHYEIDTKSGLMCYQNVAIFYYVRNLNELKKIRIFLCPLGNPGI